jgi:hypothetical protein
MKYIKYKYITYRGELLGNESCKKFFKFVTLPELKIFKTLGFILTIIF